jgi:hypothetical protein
MSPINRDLIPKLPLYTLFCVLWSFGMASEPIRKPLIDFSDESVVQQWISVNDNVMGGISEGQFRS